MSAILLLRSISMHQRGEKSLAVSQDYNLHVEDVANSLLFWSVLSPDGQFSSGLIVMMSGHCCDGTIFLSSAGMCVFFELKLEALTALYSMMLPLKIS